MKEWAKDVFKNVRELYAVLDPEEREFLRKKREMKVGGFSRFVNDRQWQKMVEYDKKYRRRTWEEEQKRLKRVEEAISRIKAILDNWNGDYGREYDRLLYWLRRLKRNVASKQTFYEVLKMVAMKDLELFDFVVQDIYKSAEVRATISSYIRNVVLQELYGTGYDSQYYLEMEKELEWVEYVLGRQNVKKKSWVEVLQNKYPIK